MAEIWNCLEEYDIPSPRMSFDFGDKGKVTLDCCFSEAIWAQLVAIRLSNSLVTGRPYAIPAGERGEAARRYSLLQTGPQVLPREASRLVVALRQAQFDRAR